MPHVLTESGTAEFRVHVVGEVAVLRTVVIGDLGPIGHPPSVRGQRARSKPRLVIARLGNSSKKRPERRRRSPGRPAPTDAGIVRVTWPALVFASCAADRHHVADDYGGRRIRALVASG